MKKRKGRKRGKRKIKIKHNKTIFVAIIILAIITIGLFYIIQQREDDTGECRVNADCVKQRTSCCGCTMGGEDVCMSKTNASYWQNKLAGQCNNVMCAAVYNCRDTDCVCQNNKCVEVER